MKAHGFLDGLVLAGNHFRSKNLKFRMEGKEKMIFVLGDALPKIYDVGTTIFNVTSKLFGDKYDSCVKGYVNALIDTWTKAFGEKHLIARQYITGRVETVLKHYYNNVYTEKGRTTPKHKGKPFVKKNIRQLHKSWRKMSLQLTKTRKVPVDSLLDIGKDMDLLTGDEKSYYEDQKSNRKMYLSEEIDTEYEEMKEKEAAQRQNVLENELEEQEFMEDLDHNEGEISSMEETSTMPMQSLNQSRSRSGLVRSSIPLNHVSTQTDDVQIDRPKLRIKRKICTEKVKKSCANLSTRCNLSAEMSRVAFQSMAADMYDHEFYLSAPKDDAEPPEKKKRLPTTAADYESYGYVICSARTINDYKQMQASQVESDAAVELFSKEEHIKSTLHYDTTSRNRIDGEWPSIIIFFSSGEEFTLRPIYFAYEDREQIVCLLVETLHRLSVAASVKLGYEISSKQLWEKITSIMTDSVTKNLDIEKGIAEALNSTHIPLHLLCKSHTVEKLDSGNLDVLSKVEKAVGQRETLEKINPRLRSFFRGKKTTVEAGITALLALVTHDKSGKSASLAELFDHICEREKVVKRIFLYQERRFAKLGKAAASILEAYPILRMTLDETHTSNQLVESCSIYLQSELFFSELHALAYFNYWVTFPFLHLVEVGSQDDLLTFLPKLYHDLLCKKTDSLKNFVIPMRNISIPALTNAVVIRLVELMCVEAAEGIRLQCGREYGFGQNTEKERATDISKLTLEERKDLPTNNLITERNLSVFDQRASKSARCRNRKFTAKGIRNDMVLYKSKVSEVEKSSKKLTRLLCEREKIWNEVQKGKVKERIEAKLKKSLRSKEYNRKLLVNCKTWSGPFASPEEMLMVINKHPDRAEHILRTEIAYLAHTQRSDKLARPELYKLNNLSYEEKLENLSVLLCDETSNSCSATIADLPTNQQVLSKLTNVEIYTAPCSSGHWEINDICVVVWFIDGNYKWYLSYVKEESSDKVMVDHLYQIDKSMKFWKYPGQPDVCSVFQDQILDIKVEGEWNLLGSRTQRYTLFNEKDILKAFKRFCDTNQE